MQELCIAAASSVNERGGKTVDGRLEPLAPMHAISSSAAAAGYRMVADA